VSNKKSLQGQAGCKAFIGINPKYLFKSLPLLLRLTVTTQQISIKNMNKKNQSYQQKTGPPLAALTKQL
jgi:hypothetical protein